MNAKFLSLLVIFLVSVTIQEALAVPAVPWPVEKTQPDGTQITVYLRGDEKVFWMESLDGYTLLYDSEKYIVYAEQDQVGDMLPSKIRFGYPNLRSSAEHIRKGLRFSKSQLNEFTGVWKERADAQPQKAPAPVLGEKKALCILVDFPDKQFTKTNTEFNNLLNQIGYSANGAAGSVRDFYLENSYGQMDLTTTAVGPLQMSGEYETYLTGTAPGHRHVTREFIIEVVNLAVANGVSLQDFAADNALETFHIIFAGYGDETIGNGQQIWSHKSSVEPFTVNGVTISVYSCSPELYTGAQITNIGVITHELGHVFGAPDYYDTSYSGYPGGGEWDLMASGSWNDSGRRPAHINMFQKILYGWVTPVELTAPRQIIEMPASASAASAYTIKANVDGEMYVLENRQKVGFDAALPGHGLLVWHVHKDALGGKGSNRTHPQQLYPVAASSETMVPDNDPQSYWNRYKANINSGGTPFPGTSQKRYFTKYSTPQMFTWETLQGIDKPLTDITESDEKISFTFMQSSQVFPVTDLLATLTDGRNVTLTWTPPASGNTEGYKIFRNEVLQYTIFDKNAASFTQFDVPNGNYTYCVQSFCGGMPETEKICAEEILVTQSYTDYGFPYISNLSASASPQKVELMWKSVIEERWSSNSGDYAASASIPDRNNRECFVGTLWTPTDLQGMPNCITKIKFTPLSGQSWELGGDYEIRAYVVEQGENGWQTKQDTYPFQFPIFDRSNLVYNIENEIELGNFGPPLFFNPGETLVVGIYFRNPVENFLAVDAGGGMPHRNMFFLSEPGGMPSGNEEWKTLGEVGINTNFCFKVCFSDPVPHTIYRDYQSVGMTFTTSYTDNNVSAGTTYNYCVKSGFPTEPLYIEVTTPQPVNPNPVKNLQVSPSGDENVQLTWQIPDTYPRKELKYYTDPDPRILGEVFYGMSDFTVAIRFTSDELKNLPGYRLTGVNYYYGLTSIWEIPPVEYTICVWEGSSISNLPNLPPELVNPDILAPGKLIFQQKVEDYYGFYYSDWNILSFSTPIELNIYADLWIGIRVHKKSSFDESLHKAVYYDNYRTNQGMGAVEYIYGEYIPNQWMQDDKNFLLGGVVTSTYYANSYQISRNNEDIATLYSWNPVYTDLNPGKGIHDYCVTAIYNGDDPVLKSDPVCAEIALLDEYLWTGSIDNDWNNSGNWQDNAIPGVNSRALIRKSDHYPVLEEATPIKEIRFEPGAEIGNQHYLTGDYRAYVQLDFGTSGLSRNRWYMLSNPLQELYAGDFTFGGYPGMDMKLFQIDPQQNNKAVWKRIDGLYQPFSAGDGFIVWLAPDREENKGLKLSNGILELPYIGNTAVPADVHWTHNYTKPNSTFSGWKESNQSVVVNPSSGTTTVKRDLDKAYRLAGQTVNERLDFGPDQTQSFAIAGNPYMSSIDFAALYNYNANQSLIKDAYQIWIGASGGSGGSYAGYSVLGGVFGRDANLNDSIAPMQSFIVEKNAASATATLEFDLAAIGVTDGIRPELRSAAPQGDKLAIVASTAQAGVRTVIVSHQTGGDSFGSADSRKLFDEINNLPEVYTLKPGANNKQVATAVNVLDEITGETLIPLAIATTYKGELTFTFSGMDTYNARIFLLDTETNTETELTDKAQYEYRFNYVPEQSGGKIVSNESRFFIRLHKVTTGIETIASEAVRIYAPLPGTLQVVSTHPLRQVVVYNLHGAKVYDAQVRTNTHRIDGLVGGVYLVKVVSGNMVTTEKVIVR